jgi:hypothetical protein
MEADASRLSLRRSDLHWAVLEDETVVLDARGSRYLAINRSGTVLWRQLAQGTTRAQLVETLSRECGVDEVRARHDVDAFCERLDAEGLFEC